MMHDKRQPKGVRLAFHFTNPLPSLYCTAEMENKLRDAALAKLILWRRLSTIRQTNESAALLPILAESYLREYGEMLTELLSPQQTMH